jgi:drug/metabolite transporter (DMT)-like permease
MLAGTLKDWGNLLALVAFWGSNFMFVKLAVSAIPPATLVAARLAIGAVVLFAIVRVMGHTFPPLGRAWTPYLVLALVGNCMPFWFITWGQKSIDSALAGILMAIMPLTTLLLAHFFVAGERMTGRRMAGFLLGFLGIVALMGPAALAGVGDSPVEILAQVSVLCGALCYAVNGIIARRNLRGELVVASAAIVTLAALIGLPVALVIDQPWRLAPSWESIATIAWIGIGPTAVATIVYFKLISSAGPSFVSQLNYLVPCVAVLLGAALLHEELALAAYAGLALILGGIAISQFRR